MAGDVVISFGADDREVTRVVENLQRQNQKLIEQMNKLRQESKRGADEEAKQSQWLAKLKERSAKLEYESKLTALQAERKAEKEKADWTARLLKNSAQLAFEINLKETLDARKAAEEIKKAEKDKADWLAKLKKQSAQLEHQLNAEALRAAKSQVSVSDEHIGQLVDMAAGYVTIQTGVSLVQKAYGEWQQEMDNVAKSHKEMTDKIVADLQRTGDMRQGGEIEAWAGSVEGATREQAMQAFSAVSGGAPTADLVRRQELASQAAKLTPSLGGDLTGFSSLMGELNDVMPNRSADDVADVTAKLRATAGADAGKLTGDGFLRSVKQLAGSGAMSPEEALAMGLGAIDSNQKMDMLSKTAEALSAPASSYTPSRSELRTVDGQLKKKFFAAGGAERLNMLRTDEKMSRAVLGDETTFKMLQIDPEQMARTAQGLRDAQTGNFAEQQMQAMGGFAAGSQVLADQQTQVYTDQVNTKHGAEQAALNRVRQTIAASAHEQGGTAYMRQFAAEYASRGREFTGGLGWFGGPSGAIVNAASGAYGDTPAERQINIGQRLGLLSSEQADTLRRQEELIGKQVKALEENTKAMRESHRAVNVDAHIE